MTIKSLNSSELTSVIFVRDYVQFVFEGEKENFILSAFTLPTTALSNHKYDFQTLGWRDALCSFINKTVRTAIAEEGNSIKVEFEDGTHLEISLKDEDYEGPEAAMLTNDSGQIEVW